MEAHSDFLVRAGAVTSARRAELDAVSLLTSREGGGSVSLSSSSSSSVSYVKGLEFASSKNLTPGMTFLNGLPFPAPSDGDEDDDDDDGGNAMMMEAQRIFMTEQRHLVDLINAGLITDDSPKSIYAMLLKGDDVYPRHHPLLAEGRARYAGGSLHRGGMGGESLLMAGGDGGGDGGIDVGPGAPAPFVVEAHLDLTTRGGRSAALDFLSIMGSYPSPPRDQRRSPIGIVSRRTQAPERDFGGYQSSQSPSKGG